MSVLEKDERVLKSRRAGQTAVQPRADDLIVAQWWASATVFAFVCAFLAARTGW
jgi:hypothetical protein